jgi:hypothetical protein
MLTISGSLDFADGVDPADLLSHLADCMRAVKGRDVAIEGDTVSFRGGFFRFMVDRQEGNLLNAFGHGDLTVDSARRQVRYRLSVRQLVGINTVVWGFVAIMMLRTPEAPAPIGPVLLWIVIVGGTTLHGLFRFRSFLRKVLDAAPVSAR